MTGMDEQQFRLSRTHNKTLAYNETGGIQEFNHLVAVSDIVPTGEFSQ